MSKQSAIAESSYHNATELLNAFSGKPASNLAPIFAYSETNKIVSIDIHAFGNESTTARYTDEAEPWKEVHTILRIKTADGFEAISGVDTYKQNEFSDAVLQELVSVKQTLMQLITFDPVLVFNQLKNSHPNLSNETRASIDIALWDLAAKKAGVPLHKLLGSKRNTIKPYASLPFYYPLSEYIEAVHTYADLGYDTFKFHVWGNYEKDEALINLVEQQFAETNYKFLIDFESVYDLETALKLGKLANSKIWIAFEALIDDANLDGYATLKRELPMTIIPAGYTYYSDGYMREAIAKDAWDMGRFDITVVGGLSQALELMIIADKADLPIDVQSWGHTLAQAANLHLMLANNRTPMFEAPMPKQAFEFGTTNGNLLENSGLAHAKKIPGLGIIINWDALSKADFYATDTK